jgi:hypothetical protein
MADPFHFWPKDCDHLEMLSLQESQFFREIRRVFRSFTTAVKRVPKWPKSHENLLPSQPRRNLSFFHFLIPDLLSVSLYLSNPLAVFVLRFFIARASFQSPRALSFSPSLSKRQLRLPSLSLPLSGCSVNSRN